MNCIFHKFFLLSAYFYYAWFVQKYTAKIIHIINIIIVHSSFCVLSFMLPACRASFAEVFGTIMKVEQTCSKPLLAHIYVHLLSIRLKSSLAVAMEVYAYYSTCLISEIFSENIHLWIKYPLSLLLWNSTWSLWKRCGFYSQSSILPAFPIHQSLCTQLLALSYTRKL